MVYVQIALNPYLMSDPQVPQLIRAIDDADSATRLLLAVRALADVASEAEIPVLIAALGYNNPGAAVAAVDGLIRIGEPAVVPLLEQLDDYDYGARAWAIRALAAIADPRALPTLLDAAKNDFALSVRRAATKGLGMSRWEKLPPEQVENAQLQSLEVLLIVSQDQEWIVRYAAVVALQELALFNPKSPLLAQIDAQLNTLSHHDDNTAVRARSTLAQQRLAVARSERTP
jgi:phycocyanobilin lyase beta subunit